jgi:flagellar hook-basal body complex protein FliE
MSIAAVGSIISSVASMAPAVAQPVSTSLADFTSLLESFGNNAVSSVRNAETQSLAVLSGEGSTRELAEAVMSAEQSLQIAVSVRDKIVSAYLELSRMAI